MKQSFVRLYVTLTFLSAAALSAPSSSGDEAKFTDITSSAGIVYERVKSPRDAIFDVLKAQPVYTLNDVAVTPIKSWGAPGVALFDFDRDGDLDIYVTNGPGAANSLFSNQLADSGLVSFIDVGVTAGVASTAQDSSGVCVGDIDNDGDKDLLVLGTNEPNLMFENLGNGEFEDITSRGDLGNDARGHTTCSMGDVNGDGLLDVVIGNTWSHWENQLPIFVEPFALNDHNQVFENRGGGAFADVSAASGIENTTGFTPAADGSPTITWAIALVDLDMDGDLDIVQADDQAAIPWAAIGGVDRGLLHVFDNDGTGTFVDITVESDLAKQGQWMGLGFGDLNCDGRMDLFGSNLGDYMWQLLPLPVPLPGHAASRWFLRADDGSYIDPGVGSLTSSVFGWGAGVIDYDNDGDQDVIYHGGLDVGPFVDASNTGAILSNVNCSASFEDVRSSAASGTDHQRRNVQGVATGDLDGNGFMDVVSVANFDSPAPIPLAPYPIAFGAPYDDAALVPTFIPTGPDTFVFSGIELANGSLSVELNDGGSGHGWVKVDTVGTVGLSSRGSVNRDGVGAVVSFTPEGGATTLKPVTAGSSYASSHSDVVGFGMGSARKGTIDVLWPGGVRNRLYDVRAGWTLTFPEIPCSIDGPPNRFRPYVRCVVRTLRDLTRADVISGHERRRFLSSAMRAWREEH